MTNTVKGAVLIVNKLQVAYNFWLLKSFKTIKWSSIISYRKHGYAEYTYDIEMPKLS